MAPIPICKIWAALPLPASWRHKSRHTIHMNRPMILRRNALRWSWAPFCPAHFVAHHMTARPRFHVCVNHTPLQQQRLVRKLSRNLQNKSWKIVWHVKIPAGVTSRISPTIFEHTFWILLDCGVTQCICQKRWMAAGPHNDPHFLEVKLASN